MVRFNPLSAGDVMEIAFLLVCWFIAVAYIAGPAPKKDVDKQEHPDYVTKKIDELHK